MSKRNPNLNRTGKKSASKDKQPLSFLGPNYAPWFLLSLTLIVTGWLYLPNWEHDFTNWDDPTYVTENPAVQQLNAETISYFFDTDHPVSLNYHPLTMLSLAYDYQRAADGKAITAQNPFPGYDARYYHQTNWLLHLLNVVLVFWLFYWVGGKRIYLAWFTAMLFGIHPMHVESVAWISERKDVLYAFFYLAALLSYFQFNRKGNWLWYILTLVLFLLSLLSKAVAVSLPVVLLVFDWYQKRHFSWKAILEKIPFLALSVYFGLLAIDIQSEGAIAKEGVLSLFDRLTFASYGYWMYFVKFFAPHQLATFYPYPVPELGGSLSWWLYALFVLAIASLVGVFWFMRKKRIWVFSFLFFILTIALVIQILPVGKAVMADRYTYLPYIGWSFLLSFYLNRWIVESNRSRILQGTLVAAGLLWTIYLGRISTEQVAVWENSESLWTQTIENHPRAWVAYKNRGNWYGQNGQPDKAMEDYQVLLQQPGEADGQTWGNVGNIFRMREQYDQAFDAYQKQVELTPDDYKGYLSRGIVYSIQNQYDSALVDYARALEKQAPPAKVLLNRALSLVNAKRFEEALPDFDQMVRLEPYNSDVYMNRGVAFFSLNRFEEAIQDFSRVLQLQPNQASAYYNQAVCFYRLGDLYKAKEMSEKARQLKYPIPDSFQKVIDQVDD